MPTTNADLFVILFLLHRFASPFSFRPRFWVTGKQPETEKKHPMCIHLRSVKCRAAPQSNLSISVAAVFGMVGAWK